MVKEVSHIALTVILSFAEREIRQTLLEWVPGLTVAKAVSLARQNLQDLNLDHQLQEGRLVVCVWGKRVRADTVLQPHDRLEFVRPLRVDPKVARRERFQKQGSRGTGLFSLKRK